MLYNRPPSPEQTLSRDQKFFDMYSVVIGALILIAIAIFVFSMKMSNLTQGVYTRDTAEYQAAVKDRIRPVGQVYLAGEEKESSSPTVETPAEPEPVATVMSGPQIYNSACLVCHGAGIAGAPILGDTAQWVDRIAQGSDTLREHAILGFSGSTGSMPPKGGRVDLSDAEVEAAVDYMIEESS